MGKKISLRANDPSALNQDSLLEYKELTIRYPYCQCARLMFLLNLRQVDDQSAYKVALPVTAINLPDRTRLKEQVERLQPVSTTAQSFRQPEFPMPKEALPRRHVESFSPWSQALPRPSGPACGQPAPSFTPITDPVSSSRPNRSVHIEEVRTLLNKPQGQSVPVRKTRLQADADTLIDNFLNGKSEHTITIDENFDYNSFDPDTGHSNREDFSLGGETLAQMYLANKAPKKAIAVYENLRLKFPEKSSYFANLISKVKKDYHIK